jgi:hypothetical protein
LTVVTFDYCKERGIDHVALSFDQAKVFDSLDHGHLFHLLKTTGFGPTFVIWINILYSEINSILLVNGFLSSSSSVTRSMGQGCGLSPILNALCTEPLAHRIRSSLIFRGIPICDSSEASIANHADDTTVLAGDYTSVNTDIDIFNLYRKVSGASLNLDKSVACIINGHFYTSVWPPSLKAVHTVKTCGIYFG